MLELRGRPGWEALLAELNPLMQCMVRGLTWYSKMLLSFTFADYVAPQKHAILYILYLKV